MHKSISLAIGSRCLLASFALVGNALGIDYDSSTLNLELVPSLGLLDSWLHNILTPFTRWDSIYFLSISERGYIYEQEYAFFPGLPMMMRLMAETGEDGV